jgi:anti-anti-sigma regulatory factor
VNIRKGDSGLILTLPPECTIAKAEVDTDRIRAMISGDIKQIEVHTEAVKEIDTAYLQMLLSLRITADRQGISFMISRCCTEIKRVCELYGVEFQCKEMNHGKNDHDR